MSIGNRIMYLTNLKGMSLKEVSTRAGIPYTTLYSMVKRGTKTTSIETLRKIAVGLEMTVEDILELPPASLLPGLVDGAYVDEPENVVDVSQLYRDNKMKELFSALNRVGQKEALRLVFRLTQMPEYQKQDHTKNPPPEHSGNGERA